MCRPFLAPALCIFNCLDNSLFAVPLRHAEISLLDGLEISSTSWCQIAVQGHRRRKLPKDFSDEVGFFRQKEWKLRASGGRIPEV